MVGKIVALVAFRRCGGAPPLLSVVCGEMLSARLACFGK